MSLLVKLIKIPFLFSEYWQLFSCIILNISSIDSLRKIRQWTLEITPHMDTFLTGSSFSLPTPARKSTKIITDFCLNLIEERKKETFTVDILLAQNEVTHADTV